MSALDMDTSTDELAASLGLRYPSPARARGRVSTPLAQRSPNVRRKQLNLDVTPSLLRGLSPSKSMFFEPDQGGEESPWRIKVTVQAEPRDGSSPMKSPAPRTRVMRVPLKDADGSSPAKPKPGRKRKSDADSAIKNRKGTPMRRRSGRASNSRMSLEQPQEETPAPEEQPAKRKRGRPRKSGLPVEIESIEPEPRLSTIEVEETVSPQRPAPAKVDEKIHEVEEIVQADEQLDDDYVHIDTYAESLQSEGELPKQDDASTSFTPQEKSWRDSASPKQRPKSSDIEPARQISNVRNPFDFSSLTPLHVKHPLPSQPKLQATSKPDSRGPYTVTELYPQFWEGRFTPLPPRSSPQRSPIPFSGHQSSPATEKDASMWRNMVASQRKDTPDRESHSVEPESPTEDDDLEAESEADIPELTSRTIGEATMMQSEDFSMVSLSSLPSAKDINSSMLSRSGIEHSYSRNDQPAESRRQSSKLNKTVTFSSPLSHSFHSHGGRDSLDPENEEAEGSDEETYAHPLPEKQTPQKSILQATRESPLLPVYPLESLKSRENTLLHTPELPSTNKEYMRISYSHGQQQTPVTEPGRLPTPNSGENQPSPSQHEPYFNSDISYPEVQTSPYPEIRNTPAKSEAEMSTPPKTPDHEESPALKEKREMSLMSSGSRRSWVEEPKSPRIIALEKKWQQERENVKRTLAEAKGQIVQIESDLESSDEEVEDVEDPLPAPVPTQEQTADIWQDISASYDDGDSHVSRKRRSIHSRPLQTERPSKVARTKTRHSPSAQERNKPVQAGTPNKSFAAEVNMASVQRRAKTRTEISALFGRLGNNGDDVEPINKQIKTLLAKPSPLQHSYIEAEPDRTDVSALSDVRQLRDEMRNAQRRPPFPIAVRGTTTTIPTKVKSIDDTVTTQEDMEEDEGDDHVSDTYDRSTLVSFTGQRRPLRQLFGDPDGEASTVRPEQPSNRHAEPIAARKQVTDIVMATSSVGTSIFSFFWNTITFSHPYIPPPRPNHPSLAKASKYPLLPRVWSWSHTHWQTLDTLYQYYKRKPSRFSPTRTARPSNIGILTPAWSRCIDITFDHWGYRVRLEDTHIVLAVLYMQLLVLPSQSEYNKLYSKDLEWREQNPSERKGERISEWEVLMHLFAIIAGELLREDEARGVRVRRDLESFTYRLAGEREWRSVSDAPWFWS